MKKTFFILLGSLALNCFAQKQVFIPTEFSTDPALRTWSYSRSAQSDNFVLFWGAVVGTDPSSYSNADLRFTPSVVLDTLEKIYTRFIKDIRFCSDAPGTKLGKYKLIIVMNDTWPAGGPSGWAFGGSYDDTIGAMWVHPNATRDGGVTSHELTHSLQGQNRIDRNPAGGFNSESSGFFWETHANFMRTQMYPAFVKDDMARWMATSSYHWSSTRHHYDAFNLLYTIQQLDSLGMVNRLWQESRADEHPLVTYRRLKGWNQQQLNNFIYEYAKREVTADYTSNGAGAIIRAERRRLAKDEPHYLWRQYTLLKQLDAATGRYAVPLELAPQDYGYNIIPLYTACANRQVQVKFKGHATGNGDAGWRYGFAAVKADDSTVRYSPAYASDEAVISFEMQPGEIKLYLVVIGAPGTQTTYPWEPGFPKIKRFPYELTIQNALPEGYQPGFRSIYQGGQRHANGGGWVSNNSTVASSVYVAPNAIVRAGCTITGNARIEDNAWVEGAVIKDNAVVSGNANVYLGTLSNDVTVTDNAVVNSCNLSGNAVIRGNALEWGSTISNSVVIGGDAEIGDCSTNGVYLQTPHPNNGREQCDGKDGDDPSNIDVNAAIVPFTPAQMMIPNPVACTPVIKVDNLALIAAATTSYVSPWETLGAVNDGFVPTASNDKSSGAYGNWPNPDSLQWVQYDWSSSYVVNKLEIYWFDDGGGVLVPDTAFVAYWNDTGWVRLGSVPLVKDAFNTIEMSEVITHRMRVTMKSNTQSTGILEWRVWGYATVLPVRLLGFSGDRSKAANTLQWKVDGEDNLSNYSVEYSPDALQFTNIGTVKAVASTRTAHTYKFLHQTDNNTSYYRLRLNDINGAFVYSSVIRLNSVNVKSFFKVCNNPVNDALIVQAQLPSVCKAAAVIIDASGRKMTTRSSLNFATGTSLTNFATGDLSAGIYFLNIQFTDRSQQDIVLRFVKY